jgi:gliding motility-associated-like protein
VYVLLSSDNFLNLGNDTLLCNTSEFTLSQPGLSNYLWQDGSDDAVFTPTTTGLYTLQASNLDGCVDTDSITIQFVNSSVTVTATPSSILVGDSVQLQAFGGNTYTWSPSSGLSCDTCSNPIASPAFTTTYTVTGIDTNGCFNSAEAIVNVNIPCGEVFVPTIFSPDGIGPGANETLCIFGNCIKELRYEVYNRWGQKVFQSLEKSYCWDGSFNGKPSESGAYVYKVYYLLNDGTSKEEAGNLTLIR